MKLASCSAAISREALWKRVLGGSVIALRDDADLIRYPRRQFNVANNAPFGAIKRLDEIFGGAGLDPWTLAAFVTRHSRSSQLDPVRLIAPRLVGLIIPRLAV